MKMKYPKLNIATAFAIAASFLVLPARATAPECHSDQRQLQNNVGIGFGGKTVLAQTFVPSAPGHRVCRVKVTIRKNAAGAGDLTLRLLQAGFAQMADPITIPGGPIPMGVSVQLFDFGCHGAPLNGVFHAIQLESPTSAPADYSWRGAGGNPYVKPGNGGRGWRNINGGAGGNWNNLGLWDFAFDVYMCD